MSNKRTACIYQAKIHFHVAHVVNGINIKRYLIFIPLHGIKRNRFGQFVLFIQMISVHVRIGFFVEKIVCRSVYRRNNGNVRRFFFTLFVFRGNRNFAFFQRRYNTLFIYRRHRFIGRSIRQLKRLIINDIFHRYGGKRIAFPNGQTRRRGQRIFFYLRGFFYANIIKKHFIGITAYKSKADRRFPCDKPKGVFVESIRTVCTARPTYAVTIQCTATRLINLRRFRIQTRSMPIINVTHQRIVNGYGHVLIGIQIDLMIIRTLLGKHFHIVF